jgi:hypothetical protein
MFCAAVLTVGSRMAAADVLSVAVSSATDKSYYRVKQEDGSFRPEYYVIANGGKFPGTVRDATFDRISYPQVAGLVGQQLARQNYFLAPKARDASLLIVIYWGQTVPFNDTNYRIAVDNAALTLTSYMANKPPPTSMAERVRTGEILRRDSGDGGGNSELEFAMAQVEMENRHRDLANQENARLLGYIDAINERREIPPWADIAGLAREMEDEVEDARYYVVVAAYDFNLIREKKKKVLRWVTRISVGARGNEFDKRVAQMVASAADAFGQGGGLRRRQFGDARVILGETQYLGVAPASAVQPAGQPPR